jgi:hypothetical protein
LQSSIILEENFDNGTMPKTFWIDPGVSVSQNSNDVITGTGSLVIDNPDHTKKLTIGLGTLPNQVVLESGKAYLLEFDWKIIETVDVAVWVDVWGLENRNVGIALPGIVTGDSGKVKFPVTLGAGSNFSFAIHLLEGGGKVAVDNLKITKGGVGPWRRDFENGLVLINPLNLTYNFTAEELAGSFHRTGIKRIFGTQAPEVNNGQTVTAPLSLQPFSAIILLADRIGPACTYSILPSSENFTLSGGTSSVSVTAASSSCAWTASESLSWVSLSPTSGTGNRTVTVTATANTGIARSGSVTIAGETYIITQDEFNSSQTPGNKVTLTSPSGTTEDTTPTFTWNEDPDSTWYRLLIWD